MKKLLILLLVLFMINVKSWADTQTIEYMNLPFWAKFNDEKLIDNLKIVYENNNDLKATVLKVYEANRIVKMALANELPYVGFQGYAGRIFHSSDEVFGNIKIPDYTETHYYLPITMNYEIDIWGENRLKTKLKKKQLEIIKQDEKAAYIYVTSAFAADYYNLIRVDKLIQCQRKLIELQQEVVNSYEIKYALGTATLSDIENSKKYLTFMQEDLEKFLEKQSLLQKQMSVILADREFNDIIRSDFDELSVNFIIPQSIDFEMLNNRPDMVKSELELEKIGIDVKIAKRDFLPKFIITGNIGFNMYNISSPHKFLADLGVVPIIDLFSGGKKLQLLKFKKNQYNIALQHYEKVILTSLQETNDALYSLKTSDKIFSIINNRKESEINELDYVKIKESVGLADKLDLLQQEEKLVIVQKQFVTAEINNIIALVNLYQALGGMDLQADVQL